MDLRYQSLLLWFVGIRVSGPHDSASNSQVPLLRTAQRFVHGVRLVNFSGRERGRSTLYYFCCLQYVVLDEAFFGWPKIVCVQKHTLFLSVRVFLLSRVGLIALFCFDLFNSELG